MSGYSRWEDALIAKLRWLDFCRSMTGKRYLDGMQRSMNDAHQPAERVPPGTLAYLATESAEKADPVWVSHDVCELVDVARQTWQPNEELLPGDPFVPAGFALLARPVILDDAPWDTNNPGRSKEGLLPVRALSWLAVHDERMETGCFWIGHYTHVDDEEPGRWADNPDVTEEEMRRELHRIMPLSLVHIWQWQWGRRLMDVRPALIGGETEEASQARAYQQGALVQTLWRLGQQFVPVRERAPRALWREAMRKTPTKSKDVTVMLLRRGKVGMEVEPSGRTLTKRFVVRGYWAIRHTREGPRQTWVMPHIKGPEDAPLVVTERAVDFSR